ncbi:MAG: ribosome-associated translation inhibitor RaiA [Deltaproteobacteria bacterium]|nr:ribosome-associated translation inhibitor RaiA [Deltaproteobacteria bacterium]MCW5806841.1 ribosome-associated translation inhibitor RaiA [Deltaproteobacteria bacterium]
MAIPLHISFRDMESTPSLDQAIRDGTTKLERVYDRIERCDVTVERPHQHHRTGQQIRVRINLAVPGPDVIVDQHDENAYVAIRTAFDVARRQLEHHVDRLHGHTKRHDPQGS